MNSKQRAGIVLMCFIGLLLIYILFNSFNILILTNVVEDDNNIVTTIIYDNDAYILSRTLLILYTINFLTKLAYYLLKNNTKN